MAESLKTNNTLSVLYLAGNNIGDAGMEALTESLKINIGIRELDIHNFTMKYRISNYIVCHSWEPSIIVNLEDIKEFDNLDIIYLFVIISKNILPTEILFDIVTSLFYKV